MNKVFLAGRLAADPQKFVTSNGITQSRLSIACSDNWNKKETYFFPCVAWQSTANFINTYLKKGAAVVVDGKLIRRSYVSKEGKTVYVTEVVIESIKPFGGSSNNRTTQYNQREEKEFLDLDSQSFESFESESVVNGASSLDINNDDDNTSFDLDDEIVDLDWMKDIKS